LPALLKLFTPLFQKSSFESNGYMCANASCNSRVIVMRDGEVNNINNILDYDIDSLCLHFNHLQLRKGSTRKRRTKSLGNEYLQDQGHWLNKMKRGWCNGATFRYRFLQEIDHFAHAGEFHKPRNTKPGMETAF
jgi:hypothetical protein